MTNLVEKKCKDTEWWTPPAIIELVKEYFAIELTGQPRIPLDAATHEANPTGAEEFYCEQGESLDWLNGTFVNPPYGKEIKAFVRKIRDESEDGELIVALLPGSRWEQKYWQESVFNPYLTGLCFIRKRLRFGKPDGSICKSNPYASILYFYNAKWSNVLLTFGGLGKCVRTQCGEE